MKKEIFKMMMEYWEEYTDAYYPVDRSFESFMDFLESKLTK